MLTMRFAAMMLAVWGTGDLPAGSAAAAGFANSGRAGSGAVLLDFQADWCGPCRGMENTVAQLVAAGYPVQKINIDQNRDLARRFRISAIPCFVLVSGDQEIDRIEGPASMAELQALFNKARPVPATERPALMRGQSPDTMASTFGSSLAGSAAATDMPRPLNPSFGPAPGSSTSGNSASGAAPNAPVSAAQLLAASVRLSIEDATGFSYGSGTLVDARQGNALVLTCGHIFRDSQGKGKITVDVYGPNPQRKLVGQLVGYDLKRDVGLVSIRPAGAVTTMPVAPPSYRVSVGDKVTSVGCDNGADPTARFSKVTSLNKFLGPANLQVAGQPVQGRSGGGLFSAAGLVIGVCNAADPADNEGLFAAAGTIHAQLDLAGLASVYQRGPDNGSAGAAVVKNEARGQLPASMPKSMPAAAAASVAALSGAADTLRQLSPHERATLAELHQKAQGAEVICIVRSLTDPHAKSEIIVLDRASTQFLNQLSSERHTQDARHLTSLDVPRPSPAPSRAAPSSTSQSSVSQTSPPQDNSGKSSQPAWQPRWRANP